MTDFSTIPRSRFVHSTSKAILFKIGDYEIWIPKSQIYRPDDCCRRGFDGPVDVSDWWIETNEYQYLLEDEEEQEFDDQKNDALPGAHRIYRRIAAKYHPDRSPDTAEFMKDLNEFWQAVLADLRK